MARPPLCWNWRLRALREGGPAPIPLAEILEVSRVTIEVAQSE
ncbi:hypothetical protein U5801_04420 [Lamprobacter modestohalophilus]|nr:hypothetical protein [Lamprobacter modestohalophilus]MEA1049055.1 hypothetical protein [Lamprobacter modestohalophilus]